MLSWSLQDRLEAIDDRLGYLYRRQSQAERADLEGRVANRAEWRDAQQARSDEIRDLERERARLRMSMTEDAA